MDAIKEMMSANKRHSYKHTKSAVFETHTHFRVFRFPVAWALFAGIQLDERLFPRLYIVCQIGKNCFDFNKNSLTKIYGINM